MTLKSQNKLALGTFLSFVVFCVCWFFIRKNDLQANGIIVKGQVISEVFATKSSVMQFRYRFYYHGKMYESESPAGVANSTAFIGRTFPIRFSPQTDRSEILVTPRHFEKYRLAYPDSLAWVKQYAIKDF